MYKWQTLLAPKYGLQEFAFLVIEIVPQDDTVDVTTLLNREDYYIQELKPEYNIVPKATNFVGWKHSEESLKREYATKLL